MHILVDDTKKLYTSRYVRKYRWYEHSRLLRAVVMDGDNTQKSSDNKTIAFAVIANR